MVNAGTATEFGSSSVLVPPQISTQNGLRWDPAIDWTLAKAWLYQRLKPAANRKAPSWPHLDRPTA